MMKQQHIYTARTDQDNSGLEYFLTVATFNSVANQVILTKPTYHKKTSIVIVIFVESYSEYIYCCWLNIRGELIYSVFLFIACPITSSYVQYSSQLSQ
jgi:hypothetical protein